jgi:tetratricopeptide (TPR) repeat protein
MKILFVVLLIFSAPFMVSSEIYPEDSVASELPDSSSIKISESKESYYNRGLNFYNAKSFLQARLCFDTCLILDSTFTQARYIRALSLEKSGDLESAILESEKINLKSPDYADIDRRLKNYYLTKYLSKKWYYMLAMLLVVVFFMVIAARFIPHRKW